MCLNNKTAKKIDLLTPISGLNFCLDGLKIITFFLNKNLDFIFKKCTFIGTMIKKILRFYSDGFRSMTWGRKLWRIILIKLFIMFAILKLFFFPDILERNFETDEERSNHVLEQLTDP